MDRGAPGEALPASHHHIDIGGIELDTVADAAGHFGRDQARAGAEKRVIDRLAGPAVFFTRRALRSSSTPRRGSQVRTGLSVRWLDDKAISYAISADMSPQQQPRVGCGFLFGAG
jgi:hypothetical protein